MARRRRHAGFGAAPAEPYVSPRTSWGDPDLQGVWDYRTITPMERRPELGDRAFYTEEEVAPGDTRVVMKFAPRIAPVKVAVFPLLRNKPPLIEKARQVFELLQPHFTTEWDDRGNIGKRYRYQEEQGTPWCVTVDFDTLGEKGPELQDTVTLRDRDTMKQERVKISELVPLIAGKLRA